MSPKILGLGMDLSAGEWVLNAAVVVSMLLLAFVHVCLTKSDMHLGLAALRELGAAKVPSQHELDRQERFEAELLKVRIDIFERLRRVGIHVVFAINLIMMQQLLVNPSLSSAMALLGPLLEYGLHTVLQAGFVKIQAWSHFRIMQSLLVGSYAVWTYGVVSQETDLHAITAMEKLAAAGLVVQSVAFIDWKVPIPTYILGATAVTLKQWQIGGPVTPMMILSSVVSHVLLAGLMFCLVPWRSWSVMFWMFWCPWGLTCSASYHIYIYIIFLFMSFYCYIHIASKEHPWPILWFTSYIQAYSPSGDFLYVAGTTVREKNTLEILWPHAPVGTKLWILLAAFLIGKKTNNRVQKTLKTHCVWTRPAFCKSCFCFPRCMSYNATLLQDWNLMMRPLSFWHRVLFWGGSVTATWFWTVAVTALWRIPPRWNGSWTSRGSWVGAAFWISFWMQVAGNNFCSFCRAKPPSKKTKHTSRLACGSSCRVLILQGAHGLVSTDVFCKSCAVAGRDYYLLAFRADPDQFGIPPDAHGSHDPHGPWRFDQRQVQPRQPSESTDEVVKAIRQLVQLRFLVDIDTPRLDIEEATLSFSRSQGSRHRDGMPTLRSFVCVNDWQRVKDLFRSARESLAAEHGEHTEKVWRFPSSLLFRIPGRPGNYFRARSAVVSVGDGDEETEGPPEFVEFHLGSFDLKHLRKPREQDLESIGEDEE